MSLKSMSHSVKQFYDQAEVLRGVIVNVTDCGLEVSKFEIQ